MSDQTTAVLTSFQTLPEEHANGHTGVADPLRTKSGDGLEENVEPDHHYSSSQTSSDPYLVQVTRVETYIDDEEDTIGLQGRSEQPIHCKKMTFFLVFQHKYLNILKSSCIFLK